MLWPALGGGQGKDPRSWGFNIQEWPSKASRWMNAPASFPLGWIVLTRVPHSLPEDAQQELSSPMHSSTPHQVSCSCLPPFLLTLPACLVCAHLLSPVRLLATPWTVTCQAPLSMGCPRQESWGRLPFPPPGDLPDPRDFPGKNTEASCHFLP